MDPDLLSSPWLRLPPVVVLLVLLQVTLVAGLPVFGTKADVLLTATIAGALVIGPERGPVVGLVLGFASDLVLQTPFGLSALTYCLVAFAVGQLQSGWMKPTWWLPTSATVVASGAGIALYAGLGTVLGERAMVERHLVVTVVVAALLNGLWGMAVRPAMRWALVAVSVDAAAR